jgi:GNAT superfamily N-acetyltransferase
MEIVPASPAVWPAIVELFSAGGDCKWCWCQYWRKPGSNWSNANAIENRTDLQAQVGRQPAPGLVALRDGKALGWVGLGPREDFLRLARSRTIPQLPGDGVWVVNCFVVVRAARRSGVAGALLDAAVVYAREQGARTLEGFPVQTGGARMSSASAYTGTAGMFARAGFSVVSGTTSRAGGGLPRVVVRRDLRGGSSASGA